MNSLRNGKSQGFCRYRVSAKRKRERIKPSVKTAALQVVAGVIAGFINGLFGGGGGMIIVPALKFILGYPAEKAHATALAVMLPVSAVSCLFYSFTGIKDGLVCAFAGAGVLAGGAFGAALLKRVKAGFITVLFAVLTAAAGIKMLAF